MKTCMCLVVASAMAILDGPILNEAETSAWPYVPLPRSLPYRLAVTLTAVPGAQYFSGR